MKKSLCSFVHTLAALWLIFQSLIFYSLMLSDHIEIWNTYGTEHFNQTIRYTNTKNKPECKSLSYCTPATFKYPMVIHFDLVQYIFDMQLSQITHIILSYIISCLVSLCLRYQISCFSLLTLPAAMNAFGMRP